MNRRTLLRTASIGLATLCVALAGLATAEGRTRWQTVRTPASGPARSIGDYSSGCIQGAQALPTSGEGYKVSNPGKLRHFGHPKLVELVQSLGRDAVVAGVEPVSVGDMSQPRGGRAIGGHASHQTGLDVDLSFMPRGKAAKGEPRSVVDGKKGVIRPTAAKRVAWLLGWVGKQPGVDRVFVHPIIKRELCKTAQGDRAWLTKIRPWYGHDTHFHVRLACPGDSDACQSQAALPEGEGCGTDLDWWFSAEASADRAKSRKEYQDRASREPELPAQCQQVIAQKSS